MPIVESWPVVRDYCSSSRSPSPLLTRVLWVLLLRLSEIDLVWQRGYVQVRSYVVVPPSPVAIPPPISPASLPEITTAPRNLGGRGDTTYRVGQVEGSVKGYPRTHVVQASEPRSSKSKPK